MAKKPMDPFARKMLQGTFVYGGVMLIMFGVFTAVYLHTRPRCSDRVVASATSPGGRWTATVMERRCGEDTPFFTHVNLRPAGEDLKRGFFSGMVADGEVFVLEQDAIGSGITIQWATPTTLTIICPACNAALLHTGLRQWNGVAIEYLTTNANH